MPAAEQERITAELFQDPPPDTGRETAYLRFWYGRILDYYRGSGTKIFFLRVPRAPGTPPETPPKPTTAVRQLIGQSDVVVLDEHLLDSLERPDMMWDAMHVNREGMIRFTEIVVTEVRKALGPPRP